MTSLPNENESIDIECSLAVRPLTPNRRQQERELVLAFDSNELRRHEAWFLVETKWLDAWMSYVLGDDDDAIAPKRPGPLTNDSLFNREKFCIRDKLQLTTDYRGVNPQVYVLYAELYGTSDTKPIVRWTLDIYAMPVMIDDIRDMLHVPNLKARSLVAELNEKLETQEKGLYQGLKSHEQKERWLYRCLCRCEFLVPCLYRLLGGGPTYKKKKEIKWSDFVCCCRKRKNKNKKRRRSKKSSEIKSRDDEDNETSDAESLTSSDEETHGLLN
ncbi:hypothetical protein DD237_007911 [Peronospora effusa]|uniref:DUSP domain-containing protein n=1 Tax=Peronospora effusa TaxID=542832 RepID=A0A3R7XS10_9STRA|nr:hypothetical protein DD237_007911 [Peronospora effusa]